MVYLKACIRCGGDLYLDRDAWGAHLQCLQCGRTRDIPEKWLKLPVDPPAVAATGPPAASVA